MKSAWLAAVVGVAIFAQGSMVRAETWAVNTGIAQWGDTSSWVETTVPNAIGATALFNSPGATNRHADINGEVTIGSITFHSTSPVGGSSFVQTTRNFNLSGDVLIFDAAGAGPATITASGPGDDNSRLQSDMRFDDDVLVDVSNIVGNSTAGALTISGNVTGLGGITKIGDGQVSLGFVAGDTGQVKSWQGPTNVNGGRWRTSLGGTNAMLTSSFTINGGQLEITSAGTYTLGTGPLNLNGTGPSTGPYAGFKGALRPGSNLITTITNPVVFQSDASIGLFGNSSSMTLSGDISGPGKFILDAVAGEPHNQNGVVILTGANTSTGGTSIIQAGLRVSGANASLGTGDVLVDGLTDRGSGLLSTGRLEIETGVTNAIGDSAIVTLTGDDGAIGTPLGGILTLGAGIDDLVGGLVLGGIPQTLAGTYGSLSSAADFKSDLYFAGSGMLRLNAPAGIDGDYNDDGVVDAADYVAWQKFLGQTSGLPNDPNAGTTIDNDQYNTWVANYGEGGAGAAGGVPEPSTLILVGMLAPLALSGRRRHT